MIYERVSLQNLRFNQTLIQEENQLKKIDYSPYSTFSDHSKMKTMVQRASSGDKASGHTCISHLTCSITLQVR